MKKTKTMTVCWSAATQLLSAALLVAATCQPALGGLIGAELVVNGGAETGDTTGWIVDGVSVTNWMVFAGNYAFEGRDSGQDAFARQDIDVGALAAQIDAGQIVSHFNIHLLPGGTETADATLRFLGAGGGTIDSVVFNPPYSFQWYGYTDDRVVPVGTRRFRIEFETIATGGQANGKMDEVSLVLTPEPATLVLLAIGGLAALRRRRGLVVWLRRRT